MEACAGAHYWAREIEKLGHTARLMSQHFVTPYRKSRKNDGNDAEAACEAVGRPSMRFVPIKSAPQQDVQALHRIRFQLIKWRTALANEIRGLLGECGIVVAKGIAPLRREMPLILDDGETQLSGLFREMLGEMAERLKLLDQRVRHYDSKVEHVFGQDERCRRLARVEGVGALVATALVAAVGNAHEFKNGRELSAWLGLVPRQHSSGAAMYSWVSASAAIATYVHCSFTELAPRYVWSSDGAGRRVRRLRVRDRVAHSTVRCYAASHGSVAFAADN
jgi:transposase